MKTAGVLRNSCLILGMAVAQLAGAQEIVHALSGTVEKIDSSARTLGLKTNDGSEGTFQLPQPGISMDFDGNVKARTTPAATFSKTGTEVILYFYGNGDVRTAVAVQDLGSTQLVNTAGTVTKFDKHNHTVALKTTAGTTQTLQVDPKSVADTTMGVIDGQKFEPAKGDTLRVVASTANGAGKALFLREQ